VQLDENCRELCWQYELSLPNDAERQVLQRECRSINQLIDFFKEGGGAAQLRASVACAAGVALIVYAVSKP
jgi:hypothetical protein